MNILFLFGCIAAYLVVGMVVTIWTYQPEQDGWLWAILLWPLQLLARMVP